MGYTKRSSKVVAAEHQDAGGGRFSLAVGSLDAEGFVLTASKSGTSFLLQSPETPASLDESGNDARSRLIVRLEADEEFRAAVKAFILAVAGWRSTCALSFPGNPTSTRVLAALGTCSTRRGGSSSGTADEERPEWAGNP
jgi:hypothetical protein